MKHLKNAEWFILESISYMNPIGFKEHVLFYIELPIRTVQFMWAMRNENEI